MASRRAAEPFRVLIVGGGISGLTLANCLEIADIDYLLFEARDDITPFVGAGLCLNPGSGPLLEQLGIRKQLFDKIAPLQYVGMHYPNGDYAAVPRGDVPLSDIRCGYTRGFIERGEILKALYENLPESSKKTKILRNKRISKVDHARENVSVHCTDGTTYQGDVVAGADGVRSKVRSEMWRASNETDNTIPKSEQKPAYATFGCLFGISRPIPDFYPRYFDVIPDKGHSIMWAVADDKIFWYVCYTLPKLLEPGEVRFTDADAESLAMKLADCPVMPNGKHRFRDLWDNRTTAILLPTEMGEHKTVAWGRFALLGDTVHKQTISAGQGGNLCMESAAALTNTLKRVLDENRGRKPSLDQIQIALVQNYQNPRAARVASYVEKVNGHTALICKYNLVLKLVQEYILPLLPGDAGAGFFSDLEIGADMLDFIPPPKAAVSGTMALNKQLGAGRRESLSSRAMRGLPLLLLFVVAVIKMDPSKGGAELEEMMRSGRIIWKSGSLSTFSSFYQIAPVDHLVRVITTFCAGWTVGFDEEASWQVLTFFIDYATFYTIFLIESCRCANVLTLAKLALVWGILCQVLGIGWCGQLYYFLYYVASQMDNYRALDLRTTDLQYTRTILPAMATFYVPFFLSMSGSVSPERRYYWGWVWQLFPVWVALIQYILAKLGVSKSTLTYDRMSAPNRDLPTIRFTIRACAAISASVWLYTLTQAPFFALYEFIPSWNMPDGIWACARNFIAWDHVLASVGAFVWLALLFRDLKFWEKTEASWLRLIVSAVVLAPLIGPGATVALGWLWREELLANKKMKGALLENTWEERGLKPSGKANGIHV